MAAILDWQNDPLRLPLNLVYLELLKTGDVGESKVEGDKRNNIEDIFDLDMNDQLIRKLDFKVKDSEIRLRTSENNDGGNAMQVKDEEVFTKMSRFEKAGEPNKNNVVVDIDPKVEETVAKMLNSVDEESSISVIESLIMKVMCIKT